MLTLIKGKDPVAGKKDLFLIITLVLNLITKKKTNLLSASGAADPQAGDVSDPYIFCPPRSVGVTHVYY